MAVKIDPSTTPFIKQETRGIPKTFRLNSVQRDILNRVAKIEEAPSTSDVILRALAFYACDVHRRTGDTRLGRLLRGE